MARRAEKRWEVSDRLGIGTLGPRGVPEVCGGRSVRRVWQGPEAVRAFPELSLPAAARAWEWFPSRLLLHPDAGRSAAPAVEREEG